MLKDLLRDNLEVITSDGKSYLIDNLYDNIALLVSYESFYYMTADDFDEFLKHKTDPTKDIIGLYNEYGSINKF